MRTKGRGAGGSLTAGGSGLAFLILIRCIEVYEKFNTFSLQKHNILHYVTNRQYTQHVPYTCVNRNKHENHLDWIYTCTFILLSHHESLWKTLSNMMLWLRLGIRLLLRLGLGLEYMAGTCLSVGSVILLDFIPNLEHIIGMKKVTFRVPMGRLGTWQIVGMLCVRNEKTLQVSLAPFSFMEQGLSTPAHQLVLCFIYYLSWSHFCHFDVWNKVLTGWKVFHGCPCFLFPHGFPVRESLVFLALLGSTKVIPPSSQTIFFHCATCCVAEVLGWKGLAQALPCSVCPWQVL